jgi:hypothetical protein
VTFVPLSYHQTCSGRSGCDYYTEGTLHTHPTMNATWPHQVPLGQPFPVRRPVWNGWGSSDLMDGTSAAQSMFSVLFYDLPTVLVLIWLVRVVRRRRRWRR